MPHAPGFPQHSVDDERWGEVLVYKPGWGVCPASTVLEQDVVGESNSAGGPATSTPPHCPQSPPQPARWAEALRRQHRPPAQLSHQQPRALRPARPSRSLQPSRAHHMRALRLQLWPRTTSRASASTGTHLWVCSPWTSSSTCMGGGLPPGRPRATKRRARTSFCATRRWPGRHATHNKLVTLHAHTHHTRPIHRPETTAHALTNNISACPLTASWTLTASTT